MFKSTVKVKLKKAPLENTGGRVKIGILGDQESELVKIAATHEFGTDKAGKNRNIKIPERSYLRSSYDEKKKKIIAVFNKEKLNIVTGVTSKPVLLRRAGEFMKSQVKKKINTSKDWAKKNADSTLKRKAPVTKPLFNREDRIKKGINYEVED